MGRYIPSSAVVKIDGPDDAGRYSATIMLKKGGGMSATGHTASAAVKALREAMRDAEDLR